MSKINTVETKPKQRQFSRICWKHVHIQPILFKWVGGPVLFLKTYHIENLNSKNVQSLITMGEDRSFGNIFWLYNFRVFDIIKFVTFHKSWDRIWESYAKAKSYLISQEGQFFNKKSKKTYKFVVPLYSWGLFVSKLQSQYKETVFFVPQSTRSFWYWFDWPRKDQSRSQLGVTQYFWAQDP